MAVTYQYKIDKLWVYPEAIAGFESVVGDVHFTITATDSDSGVEVTKQMNANLPVPEDGVQFTPFADLTEDQIITFVKDALGVEVITTAEEVMAEHLALKVKTSPDLPWA